MIDSLPKHSGIYFVKDSIKNLQIKIRFRSINTLLRLPKCTIPEKINKESVVPIGSIENSLSDDEKVVVIKWQQKLFSSTEYELYSDLKNCNNEQKKIYHDMIKEKERDKKQTKRKRQRKQLKTETEATNEMDSFIFTYIQQDDFKSSNDLDNYGKRNTKHLKEEPFEQMFIYAALKPDTQLAVLRWYKQESLLYIYPDFTNSQSQWYFLEIDSDYRHLYSYGIEDISPKDLPSLNSQEQFLYLPELPTQWRMEDELAKKFAMPPRRTQRCAIIFTINNLSDFEYDNVHVRYHIKLPDNTILEEGVLNASSHSISSSSYNSSLNVGLTWQITVLCEEQFDPSQSLRIFFEVISIDSWERERMEGFAHYSLNLLQPSHHTIKINCIRPVETLLEAIKRYFIGGRRKFDYERFVCEQAADSEEEALGFHCRYGERMRNSGQLSLSCQILTQRSCELLNPCVSRTSGMTLDDIMTAYKEARKRLEAVILK